MAKQPALPPALTETPAELSALVRPLSLESIATVLEVAPVGVCKVSPDGRIIYINAHGRRIVNTPGGDPLGISLRDFEKFTIWPDGSPCRYEDYPPIKAVTSGQPQGATVIGLRLPSERLLWVSVTGVPVVDPQTGEIDGAVVTVTDSSHPKHIEDSLRQSEERYRQLVTHAPDAILVHRAGIILFINEAGVKLWAGGSREDFIGRNVLEFVHPKHRDIARERISQAMAGDATPLMVQQQIRLDGKPIYVEVTGSFCIYGGQECVQVMVRDVTRRRRAERALRRAKARLEQRVAERTEQLSQSNAELRTRQRFLEQNLESQERQRQLVAYEIHDTIVQDVIGALLYIDAIDPALADAPAKSTERLQQARKLLRECIDNSRRLISGLRPPIIDEQGIVAAIEYLVSESNARGWQIRMSRDVETLRLAPAIESAMFRIVQEALTNLERHSQSSRGEVELRAVPGRIRLTIRDFGVGFDPQQTPEGHFGLEGIRLRARLAGGVATIRSQPGSGTEIVVEIPRQPGNSDENP